jgi:cytochrome c-type biogenesis protein CcmH/NrfG
MSIPAFGQESTADAPVNTCLTPQQELKLAQNIVKLKAENEELKKHVGLSVPLVITVIVGSVAVGVAATVGVYEATKR